MEYVGFDRETFKSFKDINDNRPLAYAEPSSAKEKNYLSRR